MKTIALCRIKEIMLKNGERTVNFSGVEELTFTNETGTCHLL